MCPVSIPDMGTPQSCVCMSMVVVGLFGIGVDGGGGGGGGADYRSHCLLAQVSQVSQSPQNLGFNGVPVMNNVDDPLAAPAVPPMTTVTTDPILMAPTLRVEESRVVVQQHVVPAPLPNSMPPAPTPQAQASVVSSTLGSQSISNGLTGQVRLWCTYCWVVADVTPVLTC